MNVPDEVKELVPGVVGSLVALIFLRRRTAYTWPATIGMFGGGCALSFFGTKPLAGLVNMADALGLAGFLVGLLGMATVSKMFDVLEAVDPRELVTKVLARFGL